MKLLSLFFIALITGFLMLVPACKEKTNPSPEGAAYEGNLSSTDINGLKTFYEKGYSVLDGNLFINGTDTMFSMDYLTNLKRIHGYVKIANVNTLQGLNQLDSVTGNFDINFCPNLKNLKGLDGLKYVGGEFKIQNNESLVDAEGLENLNHVGVKLKFARNDKMTSLKGLENLEVVDKVFELGFDEGFGNESLVSIAALANLKKVGDQLQVCNNAILTNLDGLQGLEDVTRIKIQGNAKLTDFCSLENLINNNGLKGSFTTEHNGYNPSLEDMKAGNCSAGN